MQRAYQPLPPSPPYPPSPAPASPRQHKVVLQREYREKEGECFNMLRDIIKDLTGAELRTRYEILRKAIDMLYTASEIQKQRGAQVGAMLAPGTHTPTNPEGTTSRTTDYSTQPPHFSQDWQSYADFDAASLYDTAHFHDQQYYTTPDMGSVPNQTRCQGCNQTSCQGCGKAWTNYPQL